MRRVVLDSQQNMVRLSAAILGLVVVGTPLVGYIWHTLNDLLSGHFNALRVAISIPVIALLVLLLQLTARVIGRLDGETRRVPLPSEESKP